MRLHVEVWRVCEGWDVGYRDRLRWPNDKLLLVDRVFIGLRRGSITMNAYYDSVRPLIIRTARQGGVNTIIKILSFGDRNQLAGERAYE